MIKIKKLNNRGIPSCCGLRLAKLGDIITLKNGDVIGIARHTDGKESCNDLCYFSVKGKVAMNSCKGTYSIEREVPNFELYIKSTKFKYCFLRTGWHFVKIGSKKGGV